jgi:hypothetical protein
MMEMLSSEEEYWRQRGRQQWILQGDANTKFFHAFANGRKRKCAIHSLSSDQGVITEKGAIQEHIYSFYRNLMGAEEPKIIGIRSDLWPPEQRVSFQENAEMMRTFTTEELDFVLHETKTDTAPGPDGLPVSFYKKFWPLLKKEVLEILNGFALGRVDIARLNFGILSLLPKVPGADNIKQYRPIALINVILSWFLRLMLAEFLQWLTELSAKLRQLLSRADSSKMAPLLCMKLFMNCIPRNFLQFCLNWTLRKLMTESIGSSFKRFFGQKGSILLLGIGLCS